MGEFDLPVAIIGAGPFGVSTAAYLRSLGVEFRIFGSPMNRWRTQMPAGMFLKSEGFASNLADPFGRCTLQQFCDEAALPYEGELVSLETFTRYAMSFQQPLVPMVEDVSVTVLDRQADKFQLRLATGEEVRAKKVVVATGLSHAEYIPAELARIACRIPVAQQRPLRSGQIQRTRGGRHRQRSIGARDGGSPERKASDSKAPRAAFVNRVA
jgi:cation diffusion facilitator CzcD-associated flavoprotein CzcO